MNMLKRVHEGEVFSPTKYLCIEAPMENSKTYANEIKTTRFELIDMDNVTILPYTNERTSAEASTHILTNCGDGATSFTDFCCEPVKDIMNVFFIDFNFQKSSNTPDSNVILFHEPMQPPASNISHTCAEFHSTTLPTNDLKDEQCSYISERTWETYLFRN